MKYTVVWDSSAIDELATMWAEAPSFVRGQITRAVDDIEAALQRRPEDLGESRRENVRLVIALPIAIVYELFPDDRQVRVLAIQFVE